jgi:hypothetical protein
MHLPDRTYLGRSAGRFGPADPMARPVLSFDPMTRPLERTENKLLQDSREFFSESEGIPKRS